MNHFWILLLFAFSLESSPVFEASLDTTKVCDDLDCANGLEVWDSTICKCLPGIPPLPCSSCYDQLSGENCDDGSPNTINEFWSESDPFYMRYRIEFVITWDSLRPGWPDGRAHFSWLGGATHNENVKFWEVGTLASPGVDQMSVTGVTTLLGEEATAAIVDGNAETSIQKQQWYCADGIDHPSCDVLFFDIMVTPEFPLISLVSMLGPSPDWFIGVESLSLLDDNGDFISQIVHELYPYDSGILSDNSVLVSDCCNREPLSNPQEVIHLITEASGELIGPGSLGKIIFTAYPDPNNCICSNGDVDADADGFAVQDDCDDNNANINPSQIEVPYNGLDDDCDPISLDDDLDQDGFLLVDDCDDTDFSINPNAIEIPNNGIDEDCDDMDLVSSTYNLANTVISIYPNPASEIINVIVNGPMRFSLTLRNVAGKSIIVADNEIMIDVKSLAEGIYLLEVENLDTKNKVVEKIVISR